MILDVDNYLAEPVGPTRMWEIHDLLMEDSETWKAYLEAGGPQAAGDAVDPATGEIIPVAWKVKYAQQSTSRCYLMAICMDPEHKGKIYYASEDFCALTTAAYPGFDAFSYNEWLTMWGELDMPLRGLIYFRDAVPLEHDTEDGEIEKANVRVIAWAWVKGEKENDHRLFFSYGNTDNNTWHASVDNDHGLRGMVELGKLTGACWSLLAQRNVVETEEVEKKTFGKQAKRRVARQGKPPAVTVINIRRTVRRVETESYERSTRTFHHRWIVDGHWRNQACGPKRSLRKRVYILPYVKGSPDAPLLVRPKVYRW